MKRTVKKRIDIRDLVMIGLLIWSTSVRAKTPKNAAFQAKAQQALAYCKAHQMNVSQCILVDMSIHSGKNRLVLWDFKGDSVVAMGICCHGSCDGASSQISSYDTAIFSNVHQSYCSSQGKYKIGTRGYSNYGIHVNYKLHGLETTNNNAYKRIIVLHSWSAVPTAEVYPDYAPNSWGCPMVSDFLMQFLDTTLQKATLPMLLWIYP